MGALEDLRSVFDSLPETVSTARVMNTPSSMMLSIAKQVIDEFSLVRVLSDLGAVAARDLGDALEAHALRPSDYAMLPELGERLSERLMQELGKDPEGFTKSLVDHLKLRG